MGMKEKNEGRTPKRVNPSTDDTLLNLMYYYINGAAIVLEVISFFDDALLKADLSKEQKAALKRELHFTGKAIHYLTARGTCSGSLTLRWVSSRRSLRTSWTSRPMISGR